jgi:cytoskeletal protein CcmA (bactofilin family)
MNQDLHRRAVVRDRMDAKESVIASDISIEGKIEGAGHVRIAGTFKGDVHVQGNLTIDVGARLIGQVRANTVVVGGELQGNIEAASRVELLETGVVSGDVKAASLTMAAGCRMRGQVEFGWAKTLSQSEKESASIPRECMRNHAAGSNAQPEDPLLPGSQPPGD